MLPHELDDGATEAVSLRPGRASPKGDDLDQLVRGSPATRMASVQAAARAGRSAFILLRRPSGVAKIALTHAECFGAVLRLWGAKRALGEADPGVSLTEVSESLQVESKVLMHPIDSLLRNGVIQSRVSYVGYQGKRALYYPTEGGAAAFALAAYLGAGSMVSVGGSTNGWAARNQSEPPNLFHFAGLLRKGGH